MIESLEYSKVEHPFIEQLRALGWGYLEGDTGVPYLTEREDFRQVLLAGRLRQALAHINLGEDGQPWLDEARINQAVGRLERLGEHRLIEANQAATGLLLKGTQVEGPDGKQVTVRFIDFDHPERNDWLAINQFRVDPPWATGGRDYVVPDVVLFVNGIPLAVVECKHPDQEEPLTEAITQLLRYSNQREGVEEPEGAERLFHYAQVLVATCFETARVGTVGASYEHYLEWKDTYPLPMAQVAEELGVERLAGLYFHWRVAMLPHRMVEYVVAHELVHLVERTHNEGFWERLERIIPDYAERQRWLREHGGMYDL